jgi:UDP-N-acetylmuramate--alanine ligase
VLDSLAAVGVAFEIDVDFSAIQDGLAKFRGTGRRFEVLYNDGDIMVVDDYAHHPTEIKATLLSARKAYPYKQITAVFQPHLYSRTRDFCAQFAEALSHADRVIITSIYAARELPIEGVSAENIVDRMHADGYANVSYSPDKDTIADNLAGTLKSRDMVIVFGAGDIRTVGENLAEQLHSRSAS